MMTTNKKISVSMVLGIIALAFVAALPAFAQQGGGNRAAFGNGAFGNITAISATSITVTPRNNGTAKTFTISASTTVTVDLKAATATDLKVGDPVQVRSKDGAAADAITEFHILKGANGNITAVSATSITIAPRTGDPKTFTISPDTKIQLNGKDAAATDLTVGTRAQVKSTDGAAADAISAMARRARPATN